MKTGILPEFQNKIFNFLIFNDEMANKTKKELAEENQRLLSELEVAYKNMEMILRQSEKEKAIAYRELEDKFNTLEKLYSELSNKENMLVHLEKLSSIGQFITEIIHELKNPLTVISGMADLLLIDDELPDRAREMVKKIPVQVKRMNGYLSRFRSMAYKGRQHFTIFNINDNLNDFIETVELIKPKNVAVSANLSTDYIAVSGDPYQTMQIFLNLAKNAFDALKKDGGCFTISSQALESGGLKKFDNSDFIQCQNNQVWQEIVGENSKFTEITFSDDGPGIPTEVLPHIFEAFITTKERGKGTGLGLSIATDITKRHNANLMVNSGANKGTTFKLIMPVESCDRKKDIAASDVNKVFA